MILQKRKEWEKEMYDLLDPYKNQLIDIVKSSITLISNIKPSVWTEENVIMQKPFPGPFKYNRTPYTREIIDCLSPDHPARWVAVMKGAQVGFSAGVIMPGCAWIIKNNPGNTFITVGAPDLIEKATEKLDIVISNAGLRNYIKPQVLRKRNNKSGDTNSKKEFSGGYINITSANNHKAIRDVSLQYGFFDDFESVKASSKESGSTRKLLEQRFAAYSDTHKIFYISTPERKQTSNIEPAYLLGDQRKYFVPCPCCGEFIELKWSIDVDNDSDNKAGITWKTDSNNKLISGSVGYICQMCGGFFDDKNKYELLNNGEWKPTTDPSKPGYYSYHLSALYAPIGMYDWEHYVNNYLEANPPGKARNESLYKSFVNLCLGETYEETGEAPRANELQNNIRNYDIGIIPDKLSINDGNGRIVLLTVSFDLNGTPDDARVDYEVLAYAENESTYSIEHGSIGTFIPNQSIAQKEKDDRVKWTYEHNRTNSVWPEVDKIISKEFKTDSGKSMKIFISGIDTGHYNYLAYPFVDKHGPNVVSLKGDKENKYIPFGIDVPNFKPGKEKQKLYIVQVGQLKDKLAALMKYNYNEVDKQQPGFMNFPQPANGLYLLKNYFSHYESEQKIIETKPDGSISAKWEKKSATHQNHFWDCRIYNLVLKDILIGMIAKEVKQKDFSWNDYVNTVLQRK
jgi:phage terminase large subunit GpA-like protein